MRKAGKKNLAAIMAAVLFACAFPMTAYADKISDLETDICQPTEGRKRKDGK